MAEAKLEQVLLCPWSHFHPTPHHIPLQGRGGTEKLELPRSLGKIAWDCQVGRLRPEHEGEESGLLQTWDTTGQAFEK